MKKKSHKDFLEELTIKNKYYRNGYILVESEYIGNKTPIKIRDRYGVCYCIPSNLLKGFSTSIVSAEDKNTYFINMCIDKFGENGNDDLSQVEYINAGTKIKVVDRVFGEYFVLPYRYLKGCRSKKAACIKIGAAHRLDGESVFNNIKNLHPDLEILPSQVYESTRKSLLVRDKYGICSCRISHLLNGHKPTIKSAINKTDYFINQAREVHSDKYDYSFVSYKNSYSKVKILGEKGVFEQTPSTHLKGQGCPTTAKESSRGVSKSWSYSSWEKRSKKSKRFTGYKVYFIECYDEETKERFYKIGRTYTSLKNRYVGKKLPYSYTIIHHIESDSARFICELERYYKNKHKEFIYTPMKKFKGMYECFYKLNINL